MSLHPPFQPHDSYILTLAQGGRESAIYSLEDGEHYTVSQVWFGSELASKKPKKWEEVNQVLEDWKPYLVVGQLGRSDSFKEWLEGHPRSGEVRYLRKLGFHLTGFLRQAEYLTEIAEELASWSLGDRASKRASGYIRHCSGGLIYLHFAYCESRVRQFPEGFSTVGFVVGEINRVIRDLLELAEYYMQLNKASIRIVNKKVVSHV